MVTDRQTDRQTHKPSAHAGEGNNYVYYWESILAVNRVVTNQFVVSLQQKTWDCFTWPIHLICHILYANKVVTILLHCHKVVIRLSQGCNNLVGKLTACVVQIHNRFGGNYSFNVSRFYVDIHCTIIVCM